MSGSLSTVPDVVEEHHDPSEDPDRPLVLKRKSLGDTIRNMRHWRRGLDVNLVEVSFLLELGVPLPLYWLAYRKRLPLWRCAAIFVAHAMVLRTEALNTGIEETANQHKKWAFHLRNAKDSGAFAVFTQYLISGIIVWFALYYRFPWEDDSVNLKIKKRR